MSKASQLASLDNGMLVKGTLRNALINGGLQIWQRGTSLPNGTGYRYCADRFAIICGNSQASTTRETFAPGEALVPSGIKYFQRIVVASGAISTPHTYYTQRIEGVSTFAGKTATLQFLARASSALKVGIELEQNFGTGGSPSASVTAIATQALTLATGLALYTVKVAIPSISGKTIGTNSDDYLAVNLWMDASSTFAVRASAIGQQSGTFDFACIQLEEGEIATPFEVRPLGLEQFLSERFYQQGTAGILGYQAAGVRAGCRYIFRTLMRAAPAVTFSATAYTNCSALVADTVTGGDAAVTATVGSLGTYEYRSGIHLDAEL